METTLKVLLAVLMIIYVISPVDIAPGPIDDLIVVIAGVAAQKSISARVED